METYKNKLPLNNGENLQINKINHFLDIETSNTTQSLTKDNHLVIKNISEKRIDKDLVIEIQRKSVYNPYDDDYEDPF